MLKRTTDCPMDWCTRPPMPVICACRRRRVRRRFWAKCSEMKEVDEAESNEALAWVVSDTLRRQDQDATSHE